MSKVTVEFINTCASCVGYEETIKQTAARYGEDVDLKIYYVGRDTGYLRKYGNITRGTMIINGKKKYDRLDRNIIEKAIAEAFEE
ncbi:MAG: thioredoxin-like (seleno)protein SaoT [Chitinophagales bacterium]